MSESPHPTVRNHVREKLARNELVLSMTARLVRTVEIATIAHTAGFDSLYVDLEHSSFSIDTTGQICMAALAHGVTPFVRVPGGAPDMIARVLDAGALGIIAPHIGSAADARAVVRAAKYPPLGERSFTGGLPHLAFRTLPAAEMFRVMNEATMVIAMIETGAALDVAEDIAAVDGVDMLFVGTNDLCAALGIPGELEHPSILAAYDRCLAAAKRHGKHVGVGGLAGQAALVRQLVARGARYVSTGTDLAFLMSAAAARAKQYAAS